jgi:hypothetical protein
VDDQTTREEQPVGVITNLLGRITGAEIMGRAEQRIWAEPTTLDGLGELHAQWLEGRLRAQPGYCAPVDVDEDDVPGMAELFAACCRAGFVTTQSQAAAACVGYDGAWWEQRAAVEGFADDATLDRLTVMADAAGLSIQAGRAGRRTNQRQAVPVTTRDGYEHTGFGAIRSVSHLADDWLGYGMCSDAAIDAVIDAWQVLVYDPEWGSNDRLWPALARFAEES